MELNYFLNVYQQLLIMTIQIIASIIALLAGLNDSVDDSMIGRIILHWLLCDSYDITLAIC